MYCKNCGTRTVGEANFCFKCGFKLETGPPQIDTKPKMYTVQTVLEEYFQGALGESKLREWIRKGKIPHARIGRRIIFRKETLDAWFDRHERSSINTNSAKGVKHLHVTNKQSNQLIS